MSKFHFPSKFVKNLSFRSPAPRPVSFPRRIDNPALPMTNSATLTNSFLPYVWYIPLLTVLSDKFHGKGREGRGRRVVASGVFSEPVGRNLIWLIFISEFRPAKINFPAKPITDIGPRLRMTTILSDGVISLTCKMGLKQVHIWFHS